MTQHTTHPSLSVSVNVNGKYYPVQHFQVEESERYNYDTKEYVPIEPTLNVEVDLDTFHKIVADDYTLINQLYSYDDEDGSRTRTLTLHIGDTLRVSTEVPRNADVTCPKCKGLFYDDQLAGYNSASKVMGKDYYGRVCLSCWEAYLQAKAARKVMRDGISDTPLGAAQAPVQADYTGYCAKCGRGVNAYLEEVLATESGIGVLCSKCYNDSLPAQAATVNVSSDDTINCERCAAVLPFDMAWHYDGKYKWVCESCREALKKESHS